MSKFKVDDRVIYNKGMSSEDRGVITELESLDDHGTGGARWWVRWDRSGTNQHSAEAYLCLENETSVQQREVNETSSLEMKLIGWILKDSPTGEEIQAACKFLKYAKD